MKVVFFEVEDWERATFEHLCDRCELQAVSEPLNERNASRFAEAQVVSTFIHSTLNGGALGRLEKLRFVATRSTGFDHIDLKYCQENGIAVSNVPTYGDNTVAEHVFGLLLTISHNLYADIEQTRRGRFAISGPRGFDLEGKVLGVVGVGAIGQHVIRIAKGFAMNVVACDVHENPRLANRLGFVYCGLDELLAKADVITLHVPASAATEKMLSDAQFERMKKGVVLINTARGDVVDVKALLKHLAEGKVAAVGLDVLPGEPQIREEAELLRSGFAEGKDLETLLADHLLLRHPNVYITPHSAFHTREAVQRILDTTVANILAFSRGKPQNLVVPVKVP